MSLGLRTLVGLLLMLIVCTSWAASGMDHVASLFALGSSARALGLGDAFCAQADLGTGVWYNPAGLAWDEHITLASFLARDFGAISYGSVTFALPYIAVGVTQLDSGDIPLRNGTLRYTSRALVGGAGLRLGPVSLGIRGKLYALSAPDSANGWAVDPALLLVTDIVRIGMVWENAWSEPIRYSDGHVEAWVPSLTAGASASLGLTSDVRWVVALAGRHVFAVSPTLHAGVELWIGPLAVRAGYDGDSVTFGLGVEFSSYALDWAYAEHGDLGDAHRVSLTFRF